MDEKVVLTVISVGVLAFFAFVGFWLVPNWANLLQTPEQRYEYLIESIWCPI